MQTGYVSSRGRKSLFLASHAGTIIPMAQTIDLFCAGTMPIDHANPSQKTVIEWGHWYYDRKPEGTSGHGAGRLVPARPAGQLKLLLDGARKGGLLGDKHGQVWWLNR